MTVIGACPGADSYRGSASGAVAKALPPPLGAVAVHETRRTLTVAVAEAWPAHGTDS